jgi:tetratricopeptide (TPR) repeat protein
MNWLRRLLGKSSVAAPAPTPGAPADGHAARAPQLFGEPRDGRPYVLVRRGKKARLVDRLRFDYEAGRRPGTDPRQADLDAILPRADRVRVLDGGLYPDEPIGTTVLAESADPQLLAALRDALRVREDRAAFEHVESLGGPTLELYAAGDRLAALALLPGQRLRWPRWRHDAPVRDPDALRAVLQRLGVDTATTGPTAGDDPMQLALLAHAPAERHALRGLSHLRRGEPDRAAVEADRALALDPACEQAHVLHAFIQIEGDQPAEAEAALSRTIDAGVRGPECFRVRAIARHRLGRLDDALSDCGQALALRADHAPTHHSRAHILVGLGRLDDAYAAASEAIRLVPEGYEGRWLRAFIELSRGNPREAIADFDRLLALLDSRGVECLDITFRAGRAAVPAGKGHRLLGPDRCGLLVSRGRAYALLGDHDHALADFEAAADADPQSLPALEARAALLLQRDEFPRALDLHDRIIDLLPDGPAYLARSQAHWQAQNLDAALDDAEAAIALSDEPHDIRGLKAELLLQAGRLDEARDELDTLIAARPDDPRAYFLRAQCWRALGLPAEQRTDLELALARDPENPMLLNALSWLLAICADDDVRDGARAVELARKASTLTRDLDPNILDTLAAALAEDGQFGEAAEVQRRAIARFKALPFPVDLDRYRHRLAQYESGLPLREEP